MSLEDGQAYRWVTLGGEGQIRIRVRESPINRVSIAFESWSMPTISDPSADGNVDTVFLTKPVTESFVTGLQQVEWDEFSGPVEAWLNGVLVGSYRMDGAGPAIEATVRCAQDHAS